MNSSVGTGMGFGVLLFIAFILFMVIMFISLLAIIVIFLLKNKSKIQDNNADNKQACNEITDTATLPYKKKLLLTKNEWLFYKSLKPAADELGYTVLSKIRVADLVEVNVPDKKDYIKYFNKINKKHIDFALAKPENLQIILLIELDDNSHKNGNERDAFIEKLYMQTGYKLLRVSGEANIKEKIEQML